MDAQTKFCCASAPDESSFQGNLYGHAAGRQRLRHGSPHRLAIIGAGDHFKPEKATAPVEPAKKIGDLHDCTPRSERECGHRLWSVPLVSLRSWRPLPVPALRQPYGMAETFG